MERRIRVTGKGKIAVKPDLIRLLLTLEGVYPNYEETLEQSAKLVEKLRECFVNLGFDKTDLKTLRFNVDTKHESYRDKHGDWKKKFLGYEFTHSMKIELDADNVILGRVLYALAHCDIKPEFRIQYTIKDVEKAKNQLLGEAVADSKEKAKVLAKAAGVELKEIITIDYSWGEISFESSPLCGGAVYEEECCEASASYDIDIEPDDIDVSDTVTVVWRIAE